MTAKETVALDKLRDELHDYHITVATHIEKCQGCRDKVDVLMLAMFGQGGQNGVNGDLRDLKGDKRRILIGLKCAWAAILVLLTALAKRLFWS